MPSNQSKFPFVLKDLSESEPEKVRNAFTLKKIQLPVMLT